MTWVYLLPDDSDPLVVTFDTTISETHEQLATVTRHPVEAGAEVADHIQTVPPGFACEVFVSNTPSADNGGIVESIDIAKRPSSPTRVDVLRFPEPTDRIKSIYETLSRLQSRKATMSVVTSIFTYEKMALVSTSLPRTEAGGASFNLSFEPINTVYTLTVTAPKPLEPRGAPAQNKGGQGAKPPGDKDAGKAKSLALKALTAMGITG